jgi:hypothetical protein
MPIQGYFRKVATVWLRVMALLFAMYAVISALYGALWTASRSVSASGGGAWAGTILYGLGGLVLWIISPALGRLAARGLDDSGTEPPAA